MKKRSWTVGQLKAATKSSFSYRQVIQKLGLRAAGGNYAQLQKYIQENSLDVSHFKGRGWNRGLSGVGIPRVPLEKVLSKNSAFQSYKVKKRLFAANLKPQQCELCGWAKRTANGYLPLELDHVNGDRTDNRLENLRILCPNCHSLTDNYRSRPRKKSARVA
jgi:hypothetical protein